MQITLCQNAQLTGSVLVTTPQLLSFKDVTKGVEMFEKMKVPHSFNVDDQTTGADLDGA